MENFIFFGVISSEVYLVSSQTSKMNLFAKIVNSWKQKITSYMFDRVLNMPLIIFGSELRVNAIYKESDQKFEMLRTTSESSNWV